MGLDYMEQQVFQIFNMTSMAEKNKFEKGKMWWRTPNKGACDPLGRENKGENSRDSL